mgnify:CR=1 FL=1
MNKFSKIKDIFYSGNPAYIGDNDSINEIAFLVDERYLTLEEIIIATKKEYIEMFDSATAIQNESYMAAGGGKAHIALKLLSGKYLNSRHIDVNYEHSFCGYYPDVLSLDKLIVVECGLTQNPTKILDYFEQGNIRECIQVPYPYESENTIKGYSFKPSRHLKDFLVFFRGKKTNLSKI